SVHTTSAPPATPLLPLPDALPIWGSRAPSSGRASSVRSQARASRPPTRAAHLPGTYRRTAAPDNRLRAQTAGALLAWAADWLGGSEEHTSELPSLTNLLCPPLLST